MQQRPTSNVLGPKREAFSRGRLAAPTFRPKYYDGMDDAQADWTDEDWLRAEADRRNDTEREEAMK